MTTPSVTFDTLNRELRSVWPFFAQVPIRPTRVEWAVKVGESVAPGAVLGRWLWPQDVHHNPNIVAPPGCAGAVQAFNDKLEENSLNEAPSQVLFWLGV